MPTDKPSKPSSSGIPKPGASTGIPRPRFAKQPTAASTKPATTSTVARPLQTSTQSRTNPAASRTGHHPATSKQATNPPVPKPVQPSVAPAAIRTASIEQIPIPQEQNVPPTETEAETRLVTPDSEPTSLGQQSVGIPEPAIPEPAVDKPEPQAATAKSELNPIESKENKAPSTFTSDAPANWAELEAKYKKDIEYLTEQAEMATIEREITEENLDACERLLAETKAKLEDALAEVGQLRQDKQEQQSNVSNISAGAAGPMAAGESVVTVLQVQKLEEQNELLTQGVVKLRNMSAEYKKALEDLQIEHEELQVKAMEFEQKEHRYLEQIKIYEEQIDVSQSAQEMVERLTQQKSELEDKLRQKLDEIDGLDQLRDLNDQLLENARDTERELMAEIDRLRVQCVNSKSERRDLEDCLVEQERSVAKLREENARLGEQIHQLRDQFKGGELIEQQKHQIENFGLTLSISESKMAEKDAEVARCKRKLAELEEQMSGLSAITKELSARNEELRQALDASSSDNAELQRALKRKMEEVSELEIRREMAEKKLANVQREADTKLASLNRTIEAMRGVEVQHEEAFKRLMDDYELVEGERRELRDQLSRSTRSLERSMQTSNMSMLTAHDSSLASLGIQLPAASSPLKAPPMGVAAPESGQQQQQQPPQSSTPLLAASQSQTSQLSSLGQQQSSSAASGARGASGSLTSAAGGAAEGPPRDEGYLAAKLRDLRGALEAVKRRNASLELELAWALVKDKASTRDTLAASSSGAKPLARGANFVAQTYDLEAARRLRQQAEQLRRDYNMAIIRQPLPVSTHNVRSQLRNEHFKQAQLRMRYQALENEAAKLLSTSSVARSRPQMQLTPVN